ncbi:MULTISPECIES: hypothetical protein [unclassified Oceanobacter]|uniref:hypothetical protein n=2 Tax=Gammaproteobacteria TaxID=1236 RepID=UPI002736A472|nr:MULTISPECIES: hypothetical protein [unclassified Oceanobacter]MDP2608622.1 hypothetical protein [Oceanobacter sp. 1_MG-2023]MDP2611616.1 hypothetical protein [Oceanobacter sp. 2_MG-2023]
MSSPLWFLTCLRRWLNTGAGTPPLAGWLLLLALVLVLTNALLIDFPAWVAGVPLWIATALLIPQIKASQRRQIGGLMLVGVAGLVFAAWQGSSASYWLKAVEGNQMLLAMIIGVSFLRLVALAGMSATERLPQGVQALQKTLFSTHLIASVLNISAALIVGDRLAHARQHQPLQPEQGMVLLRAFSACAFWSPFFAAMGLTLLSAPGAQLITLVLFGLPLALVALLFSAWEIRRNPAAKNAIGYPLRWSSLWMPLVLAVLVIVSHWIWPELAVLTLVTLIAIVFSLIWLLLTRGGKGAKDIVQHIRVGLPGMCSEIALFLGAAVLAAGVSASMNALDISVAPAQFGALEACVTLLVLVIAAIAGMHPVTSVVLAGSLLAGSVDDPNLLGLTFLMGWAIGVGISPLSGIQLSLQARFGMSARAMMWANRYYALLMLPLCCATLYGYGYLITL